jgi:hypothetical protein
MSRLSKLDTDADRALLEGQVPALIATFYQNERPPGGLAGLLDWRFHGVISHSLRAGAISGKAGECVYVPVTHLGMTYHLILVGAGTSEHPGSRGKLPEPSWLALQKNLASLKLGSFALSKSDFGNPAENTIIDNLKSDGVVLCLAP